MAQRADAARTALLGLLVLVAALGVLPHLLFWFQAGEFAFFKAAYDEDTYALWAFAGGGPAIPSQWLSRSALQSLRYLCRGSWDGALVAADVVFPALVATTSWALAGLIAARPRQRLLLAGALLFAPDLLSLGCQSIWTLQGSTPLELVRRAAAPWGGRLVPDSTTSFLTLFRTPEPQVSQVVFLGLLAVLLRMSRDANPKDEAAGLAWAGVALNAILAVVNVFQAAALVVFEGALAAALLARGRTRIAARVGGLGLVGAASMATSGIAYGQSGGARDWATVVFASRLPVLTPASVGAVIGLALLAWGRGRREAPWEGRRAASAACLATVLVLTNQQLLSGFMISARDWERYVNYPLLLLGWVLLAGRGVPSEPPLDTPRLRLLESCALAALGLVLLRAQLRTFEIQLPANSESLAMQRALGRLAPGVLAGATVVLDPPSLAPLLQVRMQRRLPILLDHTETYTQRIAPMSDAEGAWGLRSPFRERLFEYFARQSYPPRAVWRLLREEALQRYGTFLSFLFNVRDCWYANSDDRAVRDDAIRATLPAIAAAYAEYLAAAPPACRLAAVRLTTEPPRAAEPDSCFEEHVAGSVTVGRRPRTSTVYVLEQTPSPPKEPRGGASER